MSELKVYHNKRGSIKSQLTLFKKYLDKIDVTALTNSIIAQLQTRLQKVEDLWDPFNELQNEIEANAVDIEFENLERELFQDSYFQLVSDAQQLVTNYNNANNDTLSTNTSRNNSVRGSQGDVSQHRPISNIKLRTINLPKFDGSFVKWREYFDTFSAIIHLNSELSDVQKLCYLRASLTGDAASVIHSFETTEANYSIVWDLLQERYNNKRRIVQNHTRALLELTAITKESHIGYRNLIDTVQMHVRSLESLDQPVNSWDAILVPLIVSKLSSVANREWESKINADASSRDNIPSLTELIAFLTHTHDTLEAINLNKSPVEPKTQSTKSKEPQSNKKRVFVAANTNCVSCQGSHYINNCPEFLKHTPEERLDEVKRLDLCINCLNRGHRVAKCKFGKCKKCSSKHHTLLHFATPQVEQNIVPIEQIAALSSHMQVKSTQVLLATALITVFDTNGNAHLGRALLDCASQSNFISSKYCTSLKLKRINTEISVVGINQITSNTNYKCNLTIQSRFDNTRISISCLILPKICDQLPGNLIDISQLSIPANLNLADPNFTTPGEIDILLGAELFWQLLCVGQIKTGPNNPVLQSTKLGWIVSGALGIPSGNNSISKTQCNFNQSLDVQEQLAKFWSIEQFPNEKFLSPEEIDFEAHFSKTIRQNSDGRFIVTIPFKTSLDVLGDSLDIAKKRFYSLERKLQRNLSLKQRYTEFIDEYVALGHMSQISHDSNPKYKYYLPHHGVVKESSSTTKLRVVFDGSCPSTTGISINDLNTVTYGTASASFLAIRCLHELANQNRFKFPIACQAIDEDFYVDDLLSGADTIERATLICEQVSHVLRSGCFKLSKWKSNNIQIYKHLQDHSLDIHDFGAHENAKTLGLLWSCKSDQLFYNIDPNTTRNVTTKRIILSIISQIFDPLGLLGPCTIVAKILLQGLWLENISWDDEVSPELRARWFRFTEELTNLNKLEIPRHAISDNYVQLELHCFSDASESAYGTCAYIRSTDNRDKVCVRLLCAKSKVAPIKTLSIPRLELCAALLSTKLADAIVNSLNVNFTQLYFWTDSTITLAWIGRPASSLKTFVANRVAKIQDRDASHVWRHVGSSDNPADLLSRGINPKLLQDATIWWHGPTWLAADYKQWPNHVGIQMEDPPELKTKSFINTSAIVHDFDIFKKFSTLNRLQRTIAYCFRFYNNCKAVRINSDVLSVQELSHALHTLIKLAQIQCYNKEIGLLLARKTLQTSSAMLKLNPFIDEIGLLRVGGRLSNSEFEFEKRHPIILPPKHALTNMIAHYEHKRLLHCGSQTLLNSLREHYWPMSGRNLTRKIVHECVVCFRNNPRPAGFIMGNLPKDRVTPTPPFYNTGVDYAGPFEIRDRRARGYKVSKAYVCLFVCLSVKAIHLELVSDLTTEGFLAAFRRFTARRGKPTNVYSDNGSNFLGAKNELLELGRLLLASKDSICEASSNESVNWHFIPPRSPHFGGLWEAGVKSMKYHLKRVLGGALLTYEDFSTVLTQIESVLNSRPISPLSSDPNDLNPLTPAHFLIGRPSTALPDVQLGHIAENRLGRFQHLQRLQQHFWSRWTREYISQLQQRLKWPKIQANLEMGSLVLIQEENLPPLCWRLGRVTELHPGKDDVVRVVTIKTSKGVLKRAVNKICPFPSDSDNCFFAAIKPSEIISM